MMMMVVVVVVKDKVWRVNEWWWCSNKIDYLSVGDKIDDKVKVGEWRRTKWYTGSSDVRDDVYIGWIGDIRHVIHQF